MTGEEMERAMKFLVKNQANFDARMDRLEAAQAETSQQIRELTTGHQQTKEFLGELSQIVAQHSQQISHISDVLLNVVEGENRNREDISAFIKLVATLTGRSLRPSSSTRRVPGRGRRGSRSPSSSGITRTS